MKRFWIALFSATIVVVLQFPNSVAMGEAKSKPCGGNQAWALISGQDGRFDESFDKNENGKICVRDPSPGSGNTPFGYNLRDDKGGIIIQPRKSR